MVGRRFFVGSALSAIGLRPTAAVHGAEPRAANTALEPLVWPVAIPPPAGVRSFAGHTDTVPDIVGRIGPRPSLVIFSEGNHLMVLLGEHILGAFPAWAMTHPRYADLDLDNIVIVTLPQPMVVQIIRTGAITLGNLTVDFTRASGLYPDIVMAGAAPLRELHTLGVLEPQARVFSRAIAAARSWSARVIRWVLVVWPTSLERALGWRRQIPWKPMRGPAIAPPSRP